MHLNILLICLILQNNILNYTYTLGLPAGALVSWAFPPSANLTLVWDEVGTWGSNLNTIAHADPGVNQKQVQISLPNEVYGGTPVAGTFCDWYNEWNVTKMTLYNIGFAPIVDIPWKSTYRVTWTGTSWTALRRIKHVDLHDYILHDHIFRNTINH